MRIREAASANFGQASISEGGYRRKTKNQKEQNPRESNSGRKDKKNRTKRKKGIKDSDIFHSMKARWMTFIQTYMSLSLSLTHFTEGKMGKTGGERSIKYVRPLELFIKTMQADKRI